MKRRPTASASRARARDMRRQSIPPRAPLRRRARRLRSCSRPQGERLKEQPKILVVDDDPDIATMLSRSLARHGFVIEATSSPSDALERAGRTRYDAAVLDLVMPEHDGAELAAALRRWPPDMPIALLTGYARSPLLNGAERPGVGVFTKPIAIQDLVDFLQAEIR